MLKKKNHNKLNYKSQLTKLLLFQNQTSLQVRIAWTNPTNMLCKQINNRHYCFCGHFLSQHVSMHQNSIDKCIAQRCNCQHFYFVPDLNLKCICKHTPFRHDMHSKKCSQCINCIGFVTEWLCKCGYRFEQHATKLEVQKGFEEQQGFVGKRNESKLLNERKQNQQTANVSLPRLTNNRGISYPKQDKVKDSLSASLVRLEVNNCLLQNINSRENECQLELKHKLRQANLRYFARFKSLATFTAETNFQKDHETNSLDLYIQPHNFRSFPLSKHISNILVNTNEHISQSICRKIISWLGSIAS